MCDDNEIQYFPKALNFFHDVQWIYNVPVTEVLLGGCLDKFPEGWLDVLRNLPCEELNDFVVNKHCKPDWPISLITFLEECESMDRLSSPVSFPDLQLPHIFLKGLSPKKQHEILYLAHLVHSHCSEENISTIVDLGAGLGYICQLLYHLYGYRILGLEANSQNVETAQRRQRELYPDSVACVKYSHCKVTQDSAAEINLKLKQEFIDSAIRGPICLIGLHACGDLSVHMSRIFSELEIAKLFVLISCCYHKLSLLEGPEESLKNEEHFRDFPLSCTLKTAVRNSNFRAGEFLRRTFLRLACQEPAERWRGMSESSHKEHAFHVIARAVLELYTVKNGCRLRKLFRKGARKSQCSNFESYIKDFLQRHTFEKVLDEKKKSTTNCSSENIEAELTSLWNENEDKLNSAEILTGLQLLLQSPAESLILSDRICWLREQGFAADVFPVMEKSLSPRSHAIISKKNQFVTKNWSN